MTAPLMDAWQAMSTNAQDAIIFVGYLSPVVVLGCLLLVRLRPMTMVKTLLKRYQSINTLIVVILGVCLSVSIAIQASTSAYKTAMAKVANRFELVVTAPGSKTDMMLATVYLQPTPTPLLQGDIYEKIAADPKVKVIAPIAYGDSYAGYPIVGSTNAFVNYLADNNVSGSLFTAKHQAIVGAGVNLKIGDTFIPQHGVHKNFSPILSDSRKKPSQAAKPAAEKVSVEQTAEQPLVHQKDGDSYYCPVPLTDETHTVVAFTQSSSSQSVSSSALTRLLNTTSSRHGNAPEQVHENDHEHTHETHTHEHEHADEHAHELPVKTIDGDTAAMDTRPTNPDETDAGNHDENTHRGAHQDTHQLGSLHADSDAHDNHNTVIAVIGKMPMTHSPWDKAIITPVESVWRLHGLPTGHAPDDTHLGEPFNSDYFPGTPAILVHPHKPFQAYALSTQYTTKDAMAFRPPTVLAKLNAQLDDMSDILTRVAFVMIGLVLCLALVAIALLSKLFEKHFQLLTSLGSPKRFIVSILWSYVTSLAACATVLGGLLGYVFSLLLADYIEGRLSVLLNIQFGWTEFTLCAVFFALSSLLGLIPALQQFRLVQSPSS